VKIKVRVLPHQYKAHVAKERYVVMSMGIASGKTATVAMIAIINMLQGKRILVIEPTYSQIKDVFMREVEKQMARYGLICIRGA
jgi:Tfp pilus assembly pilus retraction ATPase PilT